MPKLRKMLGDVNGAGCTALMRAMETQSKETIAGWAAGYVKENILPLLAGRSEDPRPAAAIAAVESCLSGEEKLSQIKPRLKDARDAAKDTADPTTEAAVRAIGTACAVLTTPTNGLGFVFYAAAALAYTRLGTAASAGDYDAAAEEVFRDALEKLRAVSVENEPNPAKLQWNC